MPDNKGDGVPFATPFIGDEEIQAVIDVLKGKWITTGAKVKEFEARVCDFTGAQTAIALSSGTAALDVALAASGLKSGWDVITTPYTFVSTVLSIIHRRGTPVFADVEEDTFNLNPDEVEKLIETQYKLEEDGTLRSTKTGNLLKGIVPVHFGGHPVDMDAINGIASKYKLFVVEDAAHAIGSFYKGVPVGKTLNPVCFSFYSNKNITTGEGGMVVTDNRALEDSMRQFSLHGMTKTNIQRYKKGSAAYDVVCEGFKANMTDISAAIGVVQVDKILKITEERRQIAQSYTSLLKGDPRFILPVEKSYCRSAWHLYPLRIKGATPEMRDAVIAKLSEKKVHVSQHFIPVYFHSFYKKYGDLRGKFPISEKLWETEISLPVFPDMKAKDVEYVVETLKGVMDKGGLK